MGDLPFYTRIHSDPEVSQYLGYGRPRTPDESRVWVERLLESYDSMQLGQLAVIRKSDGHLIGRCGMAFLEIDPSPADGGDPLGYMVRGEAPAGVTTYVERELGYTFDRSAWGHGFAREATAAVLAYAVRTGNGRIVSIIHPDNARSHRLAQSFGAKALDRIRAFNKTFDRYVWPAEPSPTPGTRLPA